jgi:hypothetical protein
VTIGEAPGRRCLGFTHTMCTKPRHLAIVVGYV